MKKISIIVPTYNEEKNLLPLVHRIHETLVAAGITYEIIIVDDHSTDKTQTVAKLLAEYYPIQLYTKIGKKGKAQSLIEGFWYATYDLLCMIDADLQYSPEVIPQMIRKIRGGADIVIADRKEQQTNNVRRFFSNSYRYLFGKFLHGLDLDIQSGLKIFKSEIIERLDLRPSGWTFDLEFIKKSLDAGYKIAAVDIIFQKRQTGDTKINVLKASYEIGINSLKLKFKRPTAIPFHPKIEKKKGKGFHYKGNEFISHSDLDHNQTALHRLSGIQITTLIFLAIITVLSLILNWHMTLIVFVSTITVLYFADLLFNLFLIYRSFAKQPEIKIKKSDIAKINDKDWPIYTVFCPLYKEWQVIPQFADAISKLDYPKDKLQVMLLLEEDDKETIAKIKELNLPAYFETVIVPHSKPKTKPKACNYGLQHARGEYAVIYDAEDIPDPLQLKKTILAFKKAKKKIICIQAKLNFYNPHQNLLTKVFTAEYSLWFDLILTGLQSIHAPIPLGGTSNHFRTKDLFKLKGWDSFNVTEDADLGMRLVKQGYRTTVIESVTLEEANSDLKNWFWQRTRWIKGYIQTYFLHMRNPRAFARSWKQPHFLIFQLVIGGKVLSMIINPLMWTITISYFVFRPYVGGLIESFFPGPIFYIGLISLVFGNFLYAYYYMVGCIKHGHDELAKYIFLVPLYWLAMSVAAWVAFYKFIVNPHHWSKTRHGLHLDKEKLRSIPLNAGKINPAINPAIN